MLIHGWQKLSGFSEMAETFPDPLGMGSRMSLISAIGTELGCSLLLIAGVATRLVALPLAFTMIVALFVVHGNDPWKVKELAACYLAVYMRCCFWGRGGFRSISFSLGKTTLPRQAATPNRSVRPLSK